MARKLDPAPKKWSWKMGYKRQAGALGPIWGPFWAHLGPLLFGACLGPIWGPLGPIWGPFGAHLGPFGPIFVWGPFWALWALAAIPVWGGYWYLGPVYLDTEGQRFGGRRLTQ